MQRICVFCGSRSGSRPAYARVATELGTLLAHRGIELVYGGGSVGLMGAVADACLAAGGEVTGVIPEALAVREIEHDRLTRLEVVDSMHTRKARMAALAEGFIALPGGLGTFEELFEILTWAQLGFHAHPVGLLDVEGYYAPLLEMLDRTVEAGFVSPESRALLLYAQDAEALLAKMENTRSPGRDAGLQHPGQL